MAGKILIVDDVATNRIVFKVKLGAACYQPLLAGDGKTCLHLAQSQYPDLIILDAVLPDQPGIEVLRRLRANPQTRDIPVVMVSATNDPDLRLAALGAGADDFLTKPIHDNVLMARLRNLLRFSESLAELGQRGDTLQALGLAEAEPAFEMQGHIALVSDRPEQHLMLRRDLCQRSRNRVEALNREEALWEAGNTTRAPDVFLIESETGGPGGGLRLMSDLRSRATTRHAAIVLLQPSARPDEAALAYDMGANLVLSGHIPAAELSLRLRRLLKCKQGADRLRASVRDGLRLAVIDPLTGLYNRRYALPRLSAIAERARVVGSGFAVMIIDLDRFKAVNDRYGHTSGDAVLSEVARRLNDQLRGSDLAARIGGEEFLVALPNVGMLEARGTAERLCNAVQALPIRLPDDTPLSVTVSIGLAVSDFRFDEDEPVTQIVERADRALMIAKADGRNQVKLSASAA